MSNTDGVLFQIEEREDNAFRRWLPVAGSLCAAISVAALVCPARFLRRAVAWELNYRGALDFLKLAKSQRESRELQVEDGWQYFLHGWTQVIGRVLGCRIDDAMFGRLADIANRRAIPPARQTSASAPGPDD